MSNPVITIPLGESCHTSVNLHTYERLKLGRFKWVAVTHTKGGRTYTYAAVHIMGRPVYLHRLLAGVEGKAKVKHRDGDTLNNTDANLKKVQYNKPKRLSRKKPYTGYKGVTWARSSGKWMAQIVANGKKHYLGLYVDKHRAAKAYDRKAVELFGKRAGLNFSCPDEVYDQTED